MMGRGLEQRIEERIPAAPGHQFRLMGRERRHFRGQHRRIRPADGPGCGEHQLGRTDFFRRHQLPAKIGHRLGSGAGGGQQSGRHQFRLTGSSQANATSINPAPAPSRARRDHRTGGAGRLMAREY